MSTWRPLNCANKAVVAGDVDQASVEPVHPGAYAGVRVGFPFGFAASGLLDTQHRMQANDSDGHLVETAQIPAKSYLSCGVVVVSAQRHLTGSLLAWGTEPLPWN